MLAWLWQCYRHDLAEVVSGLPYADGRYQTHGLPVGPSATETAYLAWRPHPNTGERAPIGFAVVGGRTSDRRSVEAFWVAPAARRCGIGLRLALEVIDRHRGPWSIAFQEDNAAAGAFWRRVAEAAFGPGGWREETRPVSHLPTAPPDHWILSI